MTRRAGPGHARKKGRVMTKPTVYWASVALLALVTIGSSSAQAKYVVRFEEVGQNVIETGSGALDVTDLTDLGGSITHKPVPWCPTIRFSVRAPWAPNCRFSSAT